MCGLIYSILLSFICCVTLMSTCNENILVIHACFIPANAEIPFVNRKPSSSSARKTNIEKAIAFLKSDGANVTGDPAKGKVQSY